MVLNAILGLNSDPGYISEFAWNDGEGFGYKGATGGGLSDFWGEPWWQTGPGVANQYSNGMREVPDVGAGRRLLHALLKLQ